MHRSLMSLSCRVAAVIVNYQTPDLLETAVRSFTEIYPEVPTVVVDNGSQDNSRQVIERLCGEIGTLSSIYLEKNLGHGPAMNHAAATLDYDAFFFLDSDTETHTGGFLEKMTAELEASDRVYGVGEVAPTNRRGFLDPNGIPALVAAFMLIRTSIYRQLPPFEQHGAPGLKNFIAAAREGYQLRDFPIQEYIHHHCRGTVDRYGYGLGLRDRLNYLLNKIRI